MASEMAEQPRVLANLADRFEEITSRVKALTDRPPYGIAFLARGSSDNAALLGRYATELSGGLPTCLIAPSIVTANHSMPTGFKGWLVVAVSQSGLTPEIVSVADRFAYAGATVVSVTNEVGSDLSRVAEYAIEIDAGPETAVPATKTVTAQMLVVLAIAGAVGPGLTRANVADIPGAVSDILGDTSSVRRIADRIVHTDRVAVVGRSFCYPAALETALKLQETSAVMAHGFSTADFRHGPIAVCGPDTPAILFAGGTVSDDDTRALIPELALRRAPIELVGSHPDSVSSWPRLSNAGECLLATVRGQQIAYFLARARGIDPDHPGGLAKVTLTH